MAGASKVVAPHMCMRCTVVALWLAASSAPSIAEPLQPAETISPVALDNRDCAGAYGALSVALPYLPGIFLMFENAPRSGIAVKAFFTEDGALSLRAARRAGEQRTQAMLAAFRAGELSLEQLIELAHACDAKYGLDPVPVTFDELLRYE